MGCGIGLTAGRIDGLVPHPAVAGMRDGLGGAIAAAMDGLLADTRAATCRSARPHPVLDPAPPLCERTFEGPDEPGCDGVVSGQSGHARVPGQGSISMFAIITRLYRIVATRRYLAA